MPTPSAHESQGDVKRTPPTRQHPTCQDMPQWFYHNFCVGSYFDMSMASAVITNSHPLLVIMRPEQANQADNGSAHGNFRRGAGAPGVSRDSAARIPVPGTYVI